MNKDMPNNILKRGYVVFAFLFAASALTLHLSGYRLAKVSPQVAGVATSTPEGMTDENLEIVPEAVMEESTTTPETATGTPPTVDDQAVISEEPVSPDTSTQEAATKTPEPVKVAPVTEADPAADFEIKAPRRSYMTPEGLEILVKREGFGKVVAKDGDTIKIVYDERIAGDAVRLNPTGTGRDPYIFQLGSDKVIEGWNLAIIGMKEGETREVVIPPHLAYGEEGSKELGVPSAAHLVFRVTLIKIN